MSTPPSPPPPSDSGQGYTPPPPDIASPPPAYTPPTYQQPAFQQPPSPYAAAPAYGGPIDASKKVPAGICGILLGALGIHKFVLGYKNEGLIMLLTSIFTCGIAAIVWSVIGLIEGIMYLTKSDEEFYRTYVVGHKGWF